MLVLGDGEGSVELVGNNVEPRRVAFHQDELCLKRRNLGAQHLVLSDQSLFAPLTILLCGAGSLSLSFRGLPDQIVEAVFADRRA